MVDGAGISVAEARSSGTYEAFEENWPSQASDTSTVPVSSGSSCGEPNVGAAADTSGTYQSVDEALRGALLSWVELEVLGHYLPATAGALSMAGDVEGAATFASGLVNSASSAEMTEMAAGEQIEYNPQFIFGTDASADSEIMQANSDAEMPQVAGQSYGNAFALIIGAFL